MVNGLVSSLEASNEDLLQCIYVFPILRNPCDCESTLCLDGFTQQIEFVKVNHR